MAPKRPDRDGTHRGQFEKNKQRIYKTQTVCGICGKPVDFSIKYPDPLSPCIDHIVPIARGGHPSDINNLQLAHRTCNRSKSDLMPQDKQGQRTAKTDIKNNVINNRVLPQTINWMKY